MNYKILGKAAMFLMIPTVILSLLIWFIVLDGSVLLNVLFGKEWYSMCFRLICLSLEIWIFIKVYNHLIKKDKYG